jgi:hypothetical protein
MAMHELALAKEAQDDARGAMEWMKRYVAYDDSLKKQDRDARMAEMTARYEAEKKEQALALAEAERLHVVMDHRPIEIPVLAHPQDIDPHRVLGPRLRTPGVVQPTPGGTASGHHVDGGRDVGKDAPLLLHRTSLQHLRLPALLSAALPSCCERWHIGDYGNGARFVKGIFRARAA